MYLRKVMTYCLFLEKPRCMSKISDVTALVGSTAFLPCNVQGTPLPTYEWRKVQNQTLLLLGLRFTASNKGLIIHDVTMGDGGKFQVKLENNVNFYHSAITLHVKGESYSYNILEVYHISDGIHFRTPKVVRNVTRH